MNKRTKLFVLGSAFATLITGILLLLDRSATVSAAGMHGHSSEGFRAGNGAHHVMYGPYHGGGGFPWLGTIVFILVGIMIFMFLLKWFKKRTNESSIEQFIHTTIATPYRPMNTQHDDVLDQWEKSLMKGEKM